MLIDETYNVVYGKLDIFYLLCKGEKGGLSCFKAEGVGEVLEKK
jgi:hypothetical protein